MKNPSIRTFSAPRLQRKQLVQVHDKTFDPWGQAAAP